MRARTRFTECRIASRMPYLENDSLDAVANSFTSTKTYSHAHTQNHEMWRRVSHLVGGRPEVVRLLPLRSPYEFE